MQTSQLVLQKVWRQLSVRDDPGLMVHHLETEDRDCSGISLHGRSPLQTKTSPEPVQTLVGGALGI